MKARGIYELCKLTILFGLFFYIMFFPNYMFYRIPWELLKLVYNFMTGAEIASTIGEVHKLDAVGRILLVWYPYCAGLSALFVCLVHRTCELRMVLAIFLSRLSIIVIACSLESLLIAMLLNIVRHIHTVGVTTTGTCMFLFTILNMTLICFLVYDLFKNRKIIRSDKIEV